MNFFKQETGPSPLTVAKTEAEILTDMFNRMSQTCFKKCVVKFHDPDLAVGEMTCVDRCVGKYMASQEKVGEVLHAFEKQMIANEAAGLKSNIPKMG